MSISYVEAGIVGLLQGVAELFPVSSLGHSVLLPAVIGGAWQRDLSVSSPESPYLAFVVGLHVATAIALVIFFRRDWVRIVRGLLSSARRRKVSTTDERLAWMLVLATIPVGISGLLLEHTFRTVLSKPVPTAVFLGLNGLVLLLAERLRRRSASRSTMRSSVTAAAGAPPRTVEADVRNERETGIESDRRLASMPFGRAVLIGAAQIAALAPGISRSGVTMAAGLVKGLSHEDAARYSFLLATPVIAAAGLLKLPDLFGPLGKGIQGQVVFGSILSGVGAYISVRFLTRYFERRSLQPFGVYCLAVSIACLAVFAIRG